MQSGLSGANNDFHFDDAGAPISILGGANIEGHGGVLAFIATDVDQHHGAFVGAEPTADLATRADTEVLYGSARSYDLVFDDGGRDLLSLDIPVGAAAGGAINLSGTTRAGEVFVASVLGHSAGGSLFVGVTTEAAGAAGGDVVISAGGGVARATALEPMRPVPRVGAPVQHVYLQRVEAAGAVRARATGEIRVGAVISAAEDVTLVAAGDLSLDNGQVRGRIVALSTDAEFTNYVGPNAVAASEQWVVYAAGPADNTYGNLDSHNTALWGADIESRPPDTIAGNRYVFAHSPTLTFTSLDATKNFGEDATGALTYSVSGYHPGVPNAFRSDDAATAYGGTPALSSPGAPPAAPVEGSPYPIEISRGSLSSAAGYDLAFDSAGRLTVRQPPRSLPMVVSGSTNWLLRDSLSTGSPTGAFLYGARPLVPIMGDWDGNGSRTPGTFEGGEFKLRNANSEGQPDIAFRFGDPRGYPVAGDWNGDGRDDVAVYRNGTWDFRYTAGDVPDLTTRRFGSGNWPFTVPVAGDWDGDGTDTIGTYASATGTWTLTNTEPLGDGPPMAPFVFWQGSGSYPVVGDWDADGIDTVGVKKSTTWSLNNANDDSGADVTFDFGGANDLPLSWRP